MATYLIVLTCPTDEGPGSNVFNQIQEKYPNHLQLSSSSILVRSQQAADQIAKGVGLKGDDREDGATGVVFKMNGVYSGYASRSLWGWLGEAEAE